MSALDALIDFDILVGGSRFGSSDELESENYLRMAKEAKTELSALRARIDELENTIRWACGQSGDFQPQPEGAGKYWWRKELRERSKVSAVFEEKP